jgi:ADP-ribosylglycohydrolase
MTKAARFEGCILGGAIGDAMGSGHENMATAPTDLYYFSGTPAQKAPVWQITDDTQLTLATIEAMTEDTKVDPESVAKAFLKRFKQRKLSGLGASTLQALQGLNVGGHWSLVGRGGEYAAGNGAAMRIAPLAFKEQLSNAQIKDICFITHHNEEAYIGALCVVIAIRAIINGHWSGKENLLDWIIPQIPDTRVRDRLIEIREMDDLLEIGRLGSSGYVVDSVPLAIAAANQVSVLGMEKMYQHLAEIGGDTDTNCSIAGQIAGALLGKTGIPDQLHRQLSALPEYEWIEQAMRGLVLKERWG